MATRGKVEAMEKASQAMVLVAVVWQVAGAAGGMGFVLQLSLSEGDAEGWTARLHGGGRGPGTGPGACE